MSRLRLTRWALAILIATSFACSEATEVSAPDRRPTLAVVAVLREGVPGEQAAALAQQFMYEPGVHATGWSVDPGVFVRFSDGASAGDVRHVASLLGKDDSVEAVSIERDFVPPPD